MKKQSIFFTFLLIFSFLSCSDDDEETIIDDGTVGVERFTILLSTQSLADVTDMPVSGNLGESNYIGIQGYVMPDFYASTNVFLTIENANSDDIIFTYAGNEVSVGEEFQIEEFFSAGNRAVIRYMPNSGNTAEFDLVFRNSLGSVLEVPYSAILTE